MLNERSEPGAVTGTGSHLSALVPDEAKPAPGVLDRLTAERSALAVQLGGHDAQLTISGPGTDAGGPSFSLPVLIGEAAARLDLPTDLPGQLLERLGLPPGWAGEPPRQRDLLLEAALLETVVGLEASLDRTIRVGEGRPGALPVRLDLQLVVGDVALSCRVSLDEDLASELADRLDRASPPAAADHSGLSCTVAVEAGWQELTAEELASLRPGDIVMMDDASLRAVAGARLAAPLMRADGAFKLKASFAPLAERAPRASEEGLRLTFELARMQTTLGALGKLAVGHALPIAADETENVDVVVGGQRIGRGERVAIGAGQGVRILSHPGGAEAPPSDPAGA